MNEVRSQFIKISQQELNSGENLESKLRKATKMGFFYVEMPEECKKLNDFALEFGNKFFHNSEIKNLKLDMPSGYSVQNHTQNERLILEDKYWNAYLSEGAASLAKKMHEVGLKVLKETLKTWNIPENEWDLATGGAVNSKGQTFITFNRYNPDRKISQGLYPHRDFGQITILFINQKGLQAKVNGEYQDVEPLEGHFIINFGRALETYFNNENELTAAWHRVEQVAQNRISFGIFMDSDFNSPIYKREGLLSVMVEPTFGAYLKRLFKETSEVKAD